MLVVLSQAVRYHVFYLRTIWINKELYPSCIIPCCHLILKYLLPGWCYTSHVYNTAEFGDKVAAHRVKFRIFQTLDTDYNLDQHYTPYYNRLDERGYSPTLSPELNNPTDLYSIVLPQDILTLTPSSPTPELSTLYALPLPESEDILHTPEIFLHPLYPAIEPMYSGGGQIRSSIFGNRFGVPFCDDSGINYCRLLSCTELLECYSRPKETIPERTLWSLPDALLDALLPASPLP